MKIAVIGLGVVGNAVLKVFQEKTDAVGYDIKTAKPSDFEELRTKDILFLCLPSPTKDGKQDLSAIEDTIQKLEQLKFKGVAVIKSTVLPGTTKRLQSQVAYDIVHNPEFLSAASAEQDFRNQKTILIGTSSQPAQVRMELFYKATFPDATLCVAGSSETEMAKYMCNVSFAVKVGLFNEFYKVCRELGIGYNASAKLASKATPWLSEMHTAVPGTDGQLGWGGMCFPKDVIAFLTLINGPSIVRTALEKNLDVRPEVGLLLPQAPGQ